MNIYYLAFKFNESCQVVTVTANQMANQLLGHTDDIVDFKFDDDSFDKKNDMYSQAFEAIIHDTDGTKYVVSFSLNNVHCLNIYEYAEDEQDELRDRKWFGEYLVAKDIPWVCILIKDDQNDKVLYSLEEQIQ